MNVIIRLQNLPWSANASDIRQFFKGLQIPEGGVHIVGGQDGDAFIAFSSDEDARQAMSLNGGKIKEVKVSLLLSSRAEMQKVIEKARSASAYMTSKMAQQLPSAEAFTNQFVNKKLPETTPVIPTQPQALMANYLQHSATTVAPMMNFQMKNIDSSLSQQVSATPIALAGNAQLPLYYAMNNTQDYIKYMNMANAAGTTYQINNSNPYGQDKTAENNLQMLGQQTDYNRQRRSNSRERQRSRSPLSSRYDDKKEKRRRTRFSSPEKTTAAVVTTNPLLTVQNPLTQLQQQIALQPQIVNANPLNNLIPNNNIVNSKLPNSIWDVPPPLNLNSYTSYNNNNPIANNYSTSNSSQYQAKSLTSYNTNNNINNNNNNHVNGASGNLEIGMCIKVSNIDKETGYGDMRKFFNGLPIGNNDIKFLKDDNGDPTGVALIRFLSSDSKKQAMTKNGWQLKSTQIMITSISEDDFENNLDSRSRRDNGRGSSYKRAYDDPRRDHDRFRERSDSRERNYDSRNRDRDRDYSNNRNMNSYNNRNNYQNNRYNNDRYDKDRGSNNFGGNRNNLNHGNNYNRRDFRRDNDGRNRNFRENNEPEEKVEYIPDENFTVLIIDDLPDRNEGDLFESFPDILGITIDKYTAYCKFKTHEAAKAVLENRFLHYIRNKRVFVEKGSEMQYDDLVKKYGKFDNPEFAGESTSNDEKKDDENTENQSENKETGDTIKEHPEDPRKSRDPRQKSNLDRPSSSQGLMLKTDCILMKNLDPQTTIEDIEKFFAEVNIQKNNMRTHILLDKRGQPCGDCFVEFKFENDVQKATSKNSHELGPNKVQVMPIPREQVQAVLNSFGDDNRQNRPPPQRDWAPPNDFGNPGCVVMISNLCYRASIDDILDEFREFDLKPDQIIRRYNDFGQPTGNACINFNTPADASKACDDYNSVMILNRPIWLRRL